MSDFVKFHDVDLKTSVLVNPAHIVYISQNGTFGSLIRLSNGASVKVEQDFDQILRGIKKAESGNSEGA
jgi:hypothetical protein